MEVLNIDLISTSRKQNAARELSRDCEDFRGKCLLTYRESLEPANEHHVVGALRYDRSAPQCLLQLLNHLLGTHAGLGVGQDLLHQHRVPPDALDRYDEQVAQLETRHALQEDDGASRVLLHLCTLSTIFASHRHTNS